MLSRISFWLLCCCICLTQFSCIKGHVPVTEVLPPSRIDSVFLNYFRLTNGVTAGIGVLSLPLSDGRTLWLFGQSHVNDFVNATGLISCTPNVHNAAMISNTAWNMTLLNNGIQDFIPSNENGAWFTPLHGYQYADTVFLFAKKEGVLFNDYTYIAKFHFPDLQLVQLDSVWMNGTWYGYTVFTDTVKGFTYCYGLRQPNMQTENPLYLARFRMNSMQAAWEFYTSNEQWVNLPSQAQPIANIPAENFSIRKVKNKFIFLTQEAGTVCNTGTHIYSQTAAYPWGNFLNKQLIYTLADHLGLVSPAAMGITLHPQYLNADDEVLITYALNGYAPCVPTCTSGYDDPEYYRVKTLRVALKKIDPAY